MFTLAGIVTFLTTGAGSFILGAVGKFIQGWLSDKRAEASLREIGRVTAERDQAIAGNEKLRDMATIASRRDSEDDVIGRLEKGEG